MGIYAPMRTTTPCSVLTITNMDVREQGYTILFHRIKMIHKYSHRDSREGLNRFIKQVKLTEKELKRIDEKNNQCGNKAQAI